MIVNIYYFHNDRKYNIPEFTVDMNYTFRDDQAMIMFIPEPENKMIKTKNYCLDYFWKPISVEFEIPYEMRNIDFEHRAWFGGKGNKINNEGVTYADYIPVMMASMETR